MIEVFVEVDGEDKALFLTKQEAEDLMFAISVGLQDMKREEYNTEYGHYGENNGPLPSK